MNKELKEEALKLADGCHAVISVLNVHNEPECLEIVSHCQYMIRKLVIELEEQSKDSNFIKDHFSFVSVK